MGTRRRLDFFREVVDDTSRGDHLITSRDWTARSKYTMTIRIYFGLLKKRVDLSSPT